MARKREDNLIPFTSEQSREQAKINGRKGGIASGEAKRRKKSMQELAILVNSLPLPEQNKKGLPAALQGNEEATYQTAFILKVYTLAVKGNVKAMKLWIDLSNAYSEEREKLEIKKLKAEIKKLNAGGSVEDSGKLAAILNYLEGDGDID